MSSNPEGWAIALQRIAHEAEAPTGALDLSELGLTELPRQLFALTYLRELYLGRASRKEQTARKEAGAPLSTNDLNLATEPLSMLGELRALSVSGMDIDDLNWAQQLASLQSLKFGSSLK
jgi:internalin A